MVNFNNDYAWERVVLTERLSHLLPDAIKLDWRFGVFEQTWKLMIDAADHHAEYFIPFYHPFYNADEIARKVVDVYMGATK